jgi:formate hydrogenlyase subunit 6/NADH:ubiquinone oxidoreductase subunit I
MQQNKPSWRLIREYAESLWQGLRLTAQHAYRSFKYTHQPVSVAHPAYFPQQVGGISLQYPHEELPVPERGRYKLHNEIEDCIVCDKCVKVCPVDCIEIEAIPSSIVIGQTSNGMNKRIHAAKFDIDMAKCCFCGLCTTVCPTACLTMTAEYDFSVFDFVEHKESFATMTTQEVQEKKAAWAAHLANQKKAASYV